MLREELDEMSRLWAHEAQTWQAQLQQEVSVCTDRVAEYQSQFLREAGDRILAYDSEAQSEVRNRTLYEYELSTLRASLGSAYSTSESLRRSEQDLRAKCHTVETVLR